MPTIKTKITRASDIIDLLFSGLTTIRNKYYILETDNPTWDEGKDARLMCVQHICDHFEMCMFNNHLYFLKLHELPVWNFQDILEEEKEELIQNRRNDLVNKAKFILFGDSFRIFEHFIRMIAPIASPGIKIDLPINKTCKEVIDKLGLNQEYKNLIDIFTSARNTVHFGGIHTKESKLITYKTIDYQFTKDAPINFGTDETNYYIIIEIVDLMIAIINSSQIKSQPQILHSYSEYIFKNE